MGALPLAAVRVDATKDALSHSDGGCIPAPSIVASSPSGYPTVEADDDPPPLCVKNSDSTSASTPITTSAQPRHSSAGRLRRSGGLFGLDGMGGAEARTGERVESMSRGERPTRETPG